MRCLTGEDTNVCLNNILISAGAWPGFLVGGGGGQQKPRCCQSSAKAYFRTAKYGKKNNSV